MNQPALSLMARGVALMALEGADPKTIEKSIAPHLRSLVAHELTDIADHLEELADQIRPASHIDRNGIEHPLPSV
jgi:hypothetical protein